MHVRHLVLPIALAVLAGCGVETGAAAATAAAARKQELDQAQKALEQSKQKVDQAQQLQQERLRAAD